MGAEVRLAGGWLDRAGVTRAVTMVSPNTALPSFRLRLASLRPALEARGWAVHAFSMPRRPEWWRVWSRRELWRRSDLVVFSKQKLLPLERALVRRWCGRWVLDFDDAVMFAKPRRPGAAPDQAWWRQRRLRRMVEGASGTVVAAQALADWAQPFAQRLEILPTPVDLARYPVASHEPSPTLRLAWIGMTGNLPYLSNLAPVLRELVAGGVRLEVHVISGGMPDLAGVPCREVPWHEDSEGASLAVCDVGLAPLPDDPWTRGKGAYRSIQYAAAGLPAVASPVGANREVVVPEKTGLWATTPEEWYGALRRLAENPELRRRMGVAARTGAIRFDLPLFVQRYLEFLDGALAAAVS
ncbi:MAG TPA: glycosyltransferase [Thermoanaerobaculaceae bacterium]|nr:glycosyltransferase [Thermoanaerobaculaceae bacterium]HRS14677.1 glycosyltransferase [Thermoanaerobaculaceae bacterium]